MRAVRGGVPIGHGPKRRPWHTEPPPTLFGAGPGPPRKKLIPYVPRMESGGGWGGVGYSPG